MSTFETMTERFESRLVESIVIVNLKGQALDVVTMPATSDYYELLKSVSDAPELLGFVQINGGESYSHSAVDVLTEFLAQDDRLHSYAGRQYGFLYDVIAARFRNSIGRILLALIEFEKPMIAGMQGRISGEYLGLTLAFDARVATADTTFSFDNVRTGIPGSPGITYLMPRYIGIGKALSLIERGATIDVHEALSLGLISDIVDNEQELVDRCQRDIRDLTEHNRHLVTCHRQHILPSSDEMETALKRYYDAMARAVMTLRDSS
jgi:enoyl-CoA hydratase/carnithine racemase